MNEPRLYHQTAEQLSDDLTVIGSRESWVLRIGHNAVEAWRSTTLLGDVIGGIDLHSSQPMDEDDTPTSGSCSVLGTGCYGSGSSLAIDELGDDFDSAYAMRDVLMSWARGRFI